MANIKTRYAEITRRAKETSIKRERERSTSPAEVEEARLAAKIRERVRSDYRTLAASKSAK
ncbi:hypothetical protein N185_17060 [Sinorhizobium sp. GW3]|nr:hypothetical protein N185_17060 [Sinorhizobium sp. GW3]